MIISIASGKGGTGKTTVATNLALSLGSCIFLDCDVEEPNAHLFLKPDLKERISVKMPVPEVDRERCSFCGKCAELCQYKAIIVVGKTVLTFHELCHGCGGCMRICPEGAIKEGEKIIGIIEKGRRGEIEFVHGRLKIGEPMSPPLIREVRRYEDRERITIIDAPPGTSCPAVESIKKTDFVLLVTEPTPFGLYDLEIAASVVKKLGIPCGIVINRSDIGDDRVKRFAKEEGIPILMEIPFERRIAEAYSRGIPVVEEIPEWKERFIELYRKIEEALK